MKDKIERYEEDISLLREELNISKKLVLNYVKEIQRLNDMLNDQHEKYVISLELGRQRVNESNNKLRNFDVLFSKLSRDIRNLNETSGLVIFSEESKDIMDNRMQIIERFSDEEDEEDEYKY